MLLYFIRHGDPIYSPDSLTPLGHRQAEAVAHRLALHGLDVIYSSSSNRAILTAKPTCEILGIDPIILDWANESHAWGQLSIQRGEHRDWIFRDPEIKALFTSKEMRRMIYEWYDHPYFEGTTVKEGYLRVRRETRAFLSSLGFDYDEEKGQYKVTKQNDDRVALFAHQGFGLTFLSCVLDIPYPELASKMDVTHTGMTVIQFDSSKDYVVPKMLELSGEGHLYKDGLPTKYHNEFYI